MKKHSFNTKFIISLIFISLLMGFTAVLGFSGQSGNLFGTNDAIGEFSINNSNERSIQKDSNPLLPVYKFMNVTNYAFYFTTSEDEKNWLIQTQASTWQYSGIAFYAYASPSTPGVTPSPTATATPTPTPTHTPTPTPPTPSPTAGCSPDGSYSGTNTTGSNGVISFTVTSNTISNLYRAVNVSSCGFTFTQTSSISASINNCSFTHTSNTGYVDQSGRQINVTLITSGTFSNGVASGQLSYTDANGCTASGSWTAHR
ncbi:MAG: hypothetical protein HQK89_04340 [Nitrospirae bacterium]|nr:hypothetical protein [Nitrospirota bacterium]